MDDRLRTTSEVADRLQIPAKTLRNWRSLGQGPQYLRVGRHVRYRDDHVEAWLADQTQDVA